MDIKELKNIDVLLKMINSDLQTKHSYKIVCRYKESLVTIDFVLPFQWNDEFYCYEPKTINSRQDDKERVYIELNSQYQATKDISKFKFKQLLDHYKNQQTNHLMLYLLENYDFYNFDMNFSDYAYNIQSLDGKWKLPIIKLDNNLDFISLHLIEHEQN
ncbi:hypothetical protein [Staphylococcus caprae]|uniref:hypothetical protein n=1 Tax=Staphylococcus caprae TaxID=29380 RepID=UPI0024801FBE|nr:hypothetical protein [Staphylococcus caprae]MDI0013494.1 hypothetical protein [Staphylococcus caprae]